MRKRTALRASGVLFLGTGVALASSMPKVISDRIVDKIMEFGDKHIHGPFTKGGGDEQATRDLISDVVVPAKWEKALWDLTVGGESTSGSVAQDTPGYSQEHDGVVMPNGAKVGPSPASSPTPPVEIVVNPEIHPPVSSVPAPPVVPAPGPSANSAPAPAVAVDHGRPDRPNDQHESANNQTIAAPPPAGTHVEPSNQQTVGPNGNPLLQAGKEPMVQAPTQQEPITINGPEIHPSEGAAPAASTPAAAPSPTPAPTPSPAPAPAPAPQPAQQQRGGRPEGGPMGGAQHAEPHSGNGGGWAGGDRGGNAGGIS